MTDPRKRNFLIRLVQSFAAALFSRFPTSRAEDLHSELHVHPQYRSSGPLDALLLKTDSRLDDFPAEIYSDEVATVLGEWTAELLQSPWTLRALTQALAPSFLGSSFRPVESHSVRPGSAIEVNRITFSEDKLLGPDAFVGELRAGLSELARIVVAEFQVTEISVAANHLTTQVHYEIVGGGAGFHREQRVGDWEIGWEAAPSSGPTPGWRVHSWSAKSETRVRVKAPVYQDIAGQSLGENPSFASQLKRGVDHWRTVLDAASGIDIYGHNGVSVGDIDCDGFDDLYVCQPAGLPNRLFRNRGDGAFEDITEGSGVGLLDNTACALFADFDNDGRQDLVVVRASGPLLFLNQGDGKFKLKPNAFQFANAPQGTFTGAAAADYDRDGRLDIYFCLYAFYQGAGQYKYPTPYYDAENGPPNFLMRNNGDGTFRDVTQESGLNRNNTRFSFCCGWSDYNGDGWPDLYVANDFGRKNLYRNNGDGTFTDVAPQAGVEDVGAGMSVCWLDYNNDGKPDLYVSDMRTAAGERISGQPAFQQNASKQIRDLYRKHAMGNSLFRNMFGAAAFQDMTAAAEVGPGRWSWSSDAWDFDHDGFADIYVVNGMVSGPLRQDLNSFFWRQVVAKSPDDARSSFDYEQGWNAINELIRADRTWSGFERNVFYVNHGDGTFSDISGAIGLDFVEDGRAFALADFDHDGRQEVFVKNRNGPQLRLLKNVMSELPPSIAFRLRGTKSNRDAIGASVVIETDRGRQMRMLQAGSGFLSQHSKDVFFGLGDAKGSVSATVRWPSGLVQSLQGLPFNRLIYVEEGAAVTRMEPFGNSARPVELTSPSDNLPALVETWLLAPLPAPNLPNVHLGDAPVLLTFCKGETSVPPIAGVRSVTINVDDSKFDASVNDTVAVYNIVYRYLFDRHRDLGLPTSFLIDAKRDIVKIYQGPVNARDVENDARNIPQTVEQRIAKALPFPGVSATYEFGRNYLSYGSVFFQLGYFEQAESSFRQAVADNPTSAEAYYGMGSALLKQDRIREARDSFEQALKQRAGYPDTRPNAWNNLGLLATREGNIEAAISSFKEALRESPDYFIALQNLGNAYRQVKQWDNARTTLERALALRPRDAEVIYSLGMVFAQTDDTARAFEYLNRSLAIDPAYPEALNNLGILYLRTRRRDEAVAKFEECIRVAPGFEQSYLNLARVYNVEGDPAKAKSILGELLKLHPDSAAARNALDHLR